MDIREKGSLAISYLFTDKKNYFNGFVIISEQRIIHGMRALRPPGNLFSNSLHYGHRISW